MGEAKQITIRTSKLRKITTDTAGTASAVNLRYVCDTDTGICRVENRGKFIYKLRDSLITDQDILSRIKALAIPPAWTNVWICTHANGHLQATGRDIKGRKQYRYHPLWNTLRNLTKFSHLLDFGNALPAIKRHIRHDIALPGMPLKKVLATIVAIMQSTGIRVGSAEYEKLYGSFGLTTLKNKHVKISGTEVRFSFKGKKGIYHNINLRNKRLARIIAMCKDLPGQELFQYFDDQGERKPIDSGMVNEYIKEISGAHFTSKDFRTWTGTTYAIEVLQELGCCDSASEIKNRINSALTAVAGKLGNTRNVCRKYYVHPIILDHYSTKRIEKYFNMLEQRKDLGSTELKPGELLLLQVLNDMKSAVIAA